MHNLPIQSYHEDTLCTMSICLGRISRRIQGTLINVWSSNSPTRQKMPTRQKQRSSMQDEQDCRFKASR